MPGPNRKRYRVTPEGFDDIGSVLDEMGEGFEHEEIGWHELRDPEALRGCEVLFINCSAEAADEDFAQEVAPVIKRFVQEGGSLYCSDWAGAIIDAAFPGEVSYDQDGEECELACNVLDEGLQELIGKRIRIHFDMGGWWRVIGKRTKARVYVCDPEAKPIILGFTCGKGHVVYTSFHNECQVSESEKKLLQFLVLRPVLASAAGQNANIVKAASCSPGKEILATINRGMRSGKYVYQSPGNEGVLYVAAWTGGGQMRMVVTEPTGKVCADVRGSSPLKFETDATRGEWTCVIEATAVPHNNFPYVLTLATRRGTRPAGNYPVPPTGPSLPGRAAGVSLVWPCYLLIDCSAAAASCAPAIGVGLSNFLRGIRQISGTRVTPAISVVPCREGRPKVDTPVPIDRLGTMNLSCEGRLDLGPCLDEMSHVLAQPQGKDRTKAFVIIVIGSPVEGPYQGEAANLRQVASQGRANVVSVGLGEVVSDQVLSSMATIPLRIRGGTPAYCAEGFKWLAQVAEQMVKALSNVTAGAVSLPAVPEGTQWLR